LTGLARSGCASGQSTIGASMTAGAVVGASLEHG
jgi:hypothetical protein